MCALDIDWSFSFSFYLIFPLTTVDILLYYLLTYLFGPYYTEKPSSDRALGIAQMKIAPTREPYRALRPPGDDPEAFHIDWYKN